MVYTIQTSAMSLHCFIECFSQTARYCDGEVVDALLEYCVETAKVLLLAMTIALAEAEAGIGSREKNSTDLKGRGSVNHPGV